MKTQTLGNRVLQVMIRQKAGVAVVAMMVLMVFFPTNFYTSFNLLDLMNSASIYMIIAFGITFVIIAGGIDLSVGGTMVMAGIITIKLMDIMPLGTAMILALIVGGIIGLINGYLVVYQKTEPLIITLGMGMLLTGIAQQLTNARPIPAMNPNFMWIANGLTLHIFPNLVLIMMAVMGLTHWILQYTEFGRNCYAIGGDYEVATNSGIAVRQTKAATFVISGLLAALGGIMLSSKLNSGSSIYGDVTALTVISAVVVGGTSLAGGVGSIPKTAIGFLVFGVMENAMNMLGIDAYIQVVLRGMVIVAILGSDSYSRKRKREAI